MCLSLTIGTFREMWTPPPPPPLALKIKKRICMHMTSCHIAKRSSFHHVQKHLGGTSLENIPLNRQGGQHLLVGCVSIQIKLLLESLKRFTRAELKYRIYRGGWVGGRGGVVFLSVGTRSQIIKCWTAHVTTWGLCFPVGDWPTSMWCQQQAKQWTADFPRSDWAVKYSNKSHPHSDLPMSLQWGGGGGCIF